MSVDQWASFDELYNNAQDVEAQCVYYVDSMLAMLRDKLNGAYTKVFNAKNVGISRSNREGLGIIDENVHMVGLDIQKDGFIFSAVSDATAHEDDEVQSNAKFTMDICNNEPTLATYKIEEVQVIAVACTHTVQFLAAVVDGAQTDIEEMATNGRFDMQKIENKNPNIKKALHEGIPMLVVKREIVKKYPLLPEMIQRAKNKVGQAQRSPDMWETLSFMAKMKIRQEKAKGGNVDFGPIKRATLTTKPNRPEDLDDYSKFLTVYGSEMQINRLVQYARKHIRPGVQVPGPLFRALANIKLPPHELVPHFAIACVMACGTGSKDKGVSTYITAGDIKDDFKRKMIEANAIMKELSSMYEKADVDVAFGRAIGVAFNLIVRKVLGKGDIPESVHHIAKDAALELQKIAKDPSAIVIPSTWEAAAAAAASSQQKGAQSKGQQKAKAKAKVEPKRVEQRTVVDFDDQGNAVNTEATTLQSMGIKVGGMLRTKDPNELKYFRVVSIVDGSVDLVEHNATKPLSANSAYVKIRLDYQKVVSDFVPVDLKTQWGEIAPLSEAPDSDVVVGKAVMLVALASMKSTQELDVRSDPTGVFSQSKIKKGGICLVPNTHGIKAVDDEGEVDNKLIIGKVDGIKYALQSCNVKNVTEPFWKTRQVHEESEANLEFKEKKVPLTVPGKDGASQQKFACTVPFLTNPEPIEPHTELTYYVLKEKKEKRPMTMIDSLRVKKQLKV